MLQFERVKIKLRSSVFGNLAPLISNPNSNNACKSPINLSVYFNHFCTSSEGEIDKLSDLLVHKHNFDPRFASRVAPKLSQLQLCKAENACLTLVFLKESGFSDHRLEKIISYKPRLLGASVEDGIKPKFRFFQEMGLSSDAISKIISYNPEILSLSLNDKIVPTVASLGQLMGSNDAVAGVLRMAPRILTSNLENTVFPKVEFFKSYGVPLERIQTVLNRYPTCFLLKLEVLKKSAETAKEMGIDASSKSFIYAVLTIASMSNEVWILKLQALRSLGFLDSDIAVMFGKAPQAFGVSMEKVKKVVELLLDTKKYAMSSIVDYPQSLQHSIEKRYMPRLQILGALESRKLIKEWPPLWRVASLSDDKFSGEFVIPYSDKASDV